MHVGHDVVQQVRGRARVVKGQDMRVLKVGGDLNFTQEAFGAHDRGKLGTQHFHGHLTIVLQVRAEEDERHAPLTKLALEAIPSGKLGLQLVENARHGEPDANAAKKLVVVRNV